MREAAAAWLTDRGLAAGERIAIAPAPESDLAVAQSQQAAVLSVVWGALSVGVVPVMVNPDLTEFERAHVLADSDPALVLDTTASLLEVIGHAGRHPLPPYPLGRAMHYTSGTTGQPKGVWAGVLSQPDAADLWGSEIDFWGITASDVTLVHGPLAHSGPLRFALYVLLAGGDALLPGRFDARRTAVALAQERPTTAFVVPSHLQRLLQLDEPLPPSPYRLLVHAGAACPSALKEAVHAWAGADRVWEFYGSTEGQFSAHGRDRLGRASRLRRPGAAGPGAAHRRRHHLVPAAGERALRVLARPGEDQERVARDRRASSGSRWATSAGSTTTATSTSTVGGPTS